MKRREILRYTAYFTGAAISAPVASALLSGCKADSAEVAEAYVPGFFNEQEYAYVSRLADTMLPKTDTPGALDVGVPATIDKMVGEVYSAENQQKFREGLKALMDKMDADNPGGFAAMESDGALMYLQDQDLHYKNPEKDWGTVEELEATARSAYFDLKAQIIGSYFNSEEVATTMLAYLPVPQEYIPCGDLQELTGGKAWAI